jgi:ubiquinol-cytochrome c reductase cytochrome c subunit
MGVFKQVLPILACIAGVLTANAAFAQADTPRGNAANGKKLFETIGCFECHGYVGQGGGAGPKLVEPPAYAAYIVQLRTPRQVMPPYTARVLNDQQAADIYAHLLTLPKPVDAKTIPLLQN